MTGFGVGKAKWPEIRSHDQRMQSDTIAMTTAEPGAIDWVVAEPPPFAVLTDFNLDRLTDWRSPSLGELMSGLPVPVWPTPPADGI